ncbi:tetratricopeptide repeat protein [Anabaena cylindrica UHCC 0172]|uniref:tetratricopeptide repeat protein n=1 Tax=Anabaena cylindrica TaxID=1165 RepID=UPI002B1F6323|nr:tetratricopeptide repeat protein [Anabaena cylindrica]MEA5552796.1 tetratricopeptide repeat protein [Anabaena cylindrica UHCC 0172]
MNFWRLIFSVMIIAFSLMFFTPGANSLPVANGEITASDLFKLGVNQLQVGNYKAAIENLDIAIQMRSDFSAAYSDRCLAYLQLQDYHQAIADCTQALNLAPNDSEAYLNRGLALYRQGHYLHAIADYNQAIALKPDNFRAHYNQGIAFAGEGNHSEAIIAYNRALTQIDPSTTLLLADIYNDRGLAYLEAQNLAAAMNDFNLAIRLNADDERAYFNRGCLGERSGNYLDAIHDFSQVIRLKPIHALAYVNRGLANYNLGYYQRAIADLQQASAYFEKQEQKLAHQKILDMLKIVQQEISFTQEIA